MHPFSEHKMLSLFEDAGIETLKVWKLHNRYCDNKYRRNADDQCSPPSIKSTNAQISIISPWWLVKTQIGLIEIGWLERVINIDWSETPIRKIITEDIVTKSETFVHAWDLGKAVEYLQNLSDHFPKLEDHPPNLPRYLDQFQE